LERKINQGGKAQGALTMSEVQEVKQEQIEELRGLINHLAMSVSLLREELRTSTNSRRGLPGIAGPVGASGADAVVKIQQADGKVQVLDPNGKVQAEIIAVPGPQGRPGESIKGDTGSTGASGLDGKSAPSLDEIVKAVLAHCGFR
jgi:hypothetical protein